MLLSHGSDMYHNIQGLWQLVRRWNPATHTFFLAWGEVTIMLEDIERILLLPYLGVRLLKSGSYTESVKGLRGSDRGS